VLMCPVRYVAYRLQNDPPFLCFVDSTGNLTFFNTRPSATKAKFVKAVHSCKRAREIILRLTYESMGNNEMD
jgi:hypothetical protein